MIATPFSTVLDAIVSAFSRVMLLIFLLGEEEM